ncbi:hypothetical protein K8U54_14715 [Pseudomonas fulva]|uniref:hypothetical protein n=1 Tax=Pseudomonas fulva TaxID=47880 RepID=UPI00201DB2A3|nr:hypothetical protein [Pseudomonas fulva]UQY32985.1 hypothetical protein K8U54_14715 [Pseudomonas fulva]
MDLLYFKMTPATINQRTEVRARHQSQADMESSIAAWRYLNGAGLLILAYYYIDTLEALLWLAQMALPA